MSEFTYSIIINQMFNILYAKSFIMTHLSTFFRSIPISIFQLVNISVNQTMPIFDFVMFCTYVYLLNLSIGRRINWFERLILLNSEEIPWTDYVILTPCLSLNWLSIYSAMILQSLRFRHNIKMQLFYMLRNISTNFQGRGRITEVELYVTMPFL